MVGFHCLLVFQTHVFSALVFFSPSNQGVYVDNCKTHLQNDEGRRWRLTLGTWGARRRETRETDLGNLARTKGDEGDGSWETLENEGRRRGRRTQGTGENAIAMQGVCTSGQDVCTNNVQDVCTNNVQDVGTNVQDVVRTCHCGRLSSMRRWKRTKKRTLMPTLCSMP